MISTSLLIVLVVGETILVVCALFAMLWSEQRTDAERRVAILATVVLALWAATGVALALRGSFQPRDDASPPPVGFALAGVLTVLAVSLVSSRSLRRLLTNQPNLCRIHLWRLLGLVFLALMVDGQVPMLWALPAGTGDLIVGATAFRMAQVVGLPNVRRTTIIWHVFGITDLIVAISLGIMTNPGPAGVFSTTPAADLLTKFPLALVPTLLVPLAFTLHVVSLWQLSGRKWV
jgi:hypothetical protein